MHSVYLLLDPREPKSKHAIRYVGSSGNPRARLRQHLAGSHALVAEWLKELARAQVKPLMLVVDGSMARGGARILEGQWLKSLRADGVALLNVNTP